MSEMHTPGHELKLHTNYARYYDSFYGKDYRLAVDLIDHLIKKHSQYPCRDILDVMCGTGAHMSGLVAKGYEKITGIDASFEMIELAGQKLTGVPNTQLVMTDVKDLRLRDEFDVVYCWFNSLQYFYTNDELVLVLGKIYSALRKDGLFIADLRNPAPLLDFIYQCGVKVSMGHITRDEAVRLVRRFDGEFPKQYFRENLEYMGITEAKFYEVIDRSRPSHLWEKRNGEWILKHQVS